MILRARGHVLEISRRPLLVGVVDIKCQGPSNAVGEAVCDALNHASAFAREGADLIEISATSFSAGEDVSARQVEAKALGEFLRLWDPKIPLMIRTNRMEVAEIVLAHGGDVLAGEVSLVGAAVAGLCARMGVALMIGTEETQGSVSPTALERAAFEAVRAGMSMERICLSLGRGTTAFVAMKKLRHLPYPLVISSPCSFSEDKDGYAGTVAWVVQAMLNGLGGIRLHELRPALAALKMIEALGQPC